MKEPRPAAPQSANQSELPRKAPSVSITPSSSPLAPSTASAASAANTTSRPRARDAAASVETSGRSIDATDPSRSAAVPALLVGINSDATDNIEAVLHLLGAQSSAAGTLDSALDHHTNLTQLDVIFLADSLTDSEIARCSSRLAEVNASASVIIVGAKANFEAAVRAMRLGAVDFLVEPVEPLTALPAVRRALEAARRERRQQGKVDKLKRVCKRINAARLDVTNQVDTLCNDLVHAYQELSDQISHVTTVTEFAAVIRQELDVEELLRTTLEYFLKKIGPMNAAVFLPSTGDEFTLGAYINYDCTRENAAFLLNHLADVISPLMAAENDLREFKCNPDLSAWMGDDAAWLADTHFVTFSCRRDDECLAIFAIWRDIHSPFAEDAVSVLPAVSEVFTRQLAHVIHVHHRHLPDALEDHDEGDDDNHFGNGDNGGNGDDDDGGGEDNNFGLAA